MEIILSATGYQSGFGTDRYKKVYGLSAEEKTLLKNKSAVVVIRSRNSGGANKMGTEFRVVEHNQYGFFPRVPNEEILQKIDELFVEGK